MKTYYYKVADHVFSVTFDDADTLDGQMSQYSPFLTERGDGSLAFSLRVLSERPDYGPTTEEMRQDDDGSQIVASRTDGMSTFDFELFGHWQGRLQCNGTYTDGTLYACGERLYGLNNALMVMFALSTAGCDTLLFHASVVSYRGQGFLMLGKSGTGKSTHTRLWLENISGTELVNDDNPVVRICADGVTRVYGSPWSGKTPCYRNVSYPVGALVQLSQAPVNEIRRIRGIEAYVALVPSISGKRWDRKVADGLHDAENKLASTVPMFHLRCLPDADAAFTCQRAVAPHVEASLKKTVDNDIAIHEVQCLLAEGHKVILPVRGQSMLPFIVGDRDSVELVVPSGRPLSVGDAVLAWTDGRRYVLHRIIDIDGDRLTLQGDGNIVGIERCGVSDVVARAEYVVHGDGSRHFLYSRGSIRRWQVWRRLRPVRRWPLAVIRRLPMFKAKD